MSEEFEKERKYNKIIYMSPDGQELNQKLSIIYHNLKTLLLFAEDTKELTREFEIYLLI